MKLNKDSMKKVYDTVVKVIGYFVIVAFITNEINKVTFKIVQTILNGKNKKGDDSNDGEFSRCSEYCSTSDDNCE